MDLKSGAKPKGKPALGEVRILTSTEADHTGLSRDTLLFRTREDEYHLIRCLSGSGRSARREQLPVSEEAVAIKELYEFWRLK